MFSSVISSPTIHQSSNPKKLLKPHCYGVRFFLKEVTLKS